MFGFLEPCCSNGGAGSKALTFPGLGLPLIAFFSLGDTSYWSSQVAPGVYCSPDWKYAPFPDGGSSCLWPLLPALLRFGKIIATFLVGNNLHLYSPPPRNHLCYFEGGHSPIIYHLQKVESMYVLVTDTTSVPGTQKAHGRL